MNNKIFHYPLLLSVILLTSCTAELMYHALPKHLESKGHLVGFKHVRAWGDEYNSDMQKSAIASVNQARTAAHGKISYEINALALSGGGADGAFGAGLLCGWTENGTRPTFKLVSGISTGALIAPFAFLGSAYDNRLKELYTSLSDDNIYKINHPLFILSTYIKPILSPAVATNKPLAEMIKKVATQQMLDDIAKEHLKGRRLFIGTTQLNAQRLVIWDIGAIANSGNPNALGLFHKILLASSALPGIFPPQYFSVNVNGEIYQEMHVDGGVETQVMLFENALSPYAKLSVDAEGKKFITHLYIIRNLKVFPEWVHVKPRLHDMAIRVISTLTKTQGIGDLYRLYAYSVRDHIDYNLAYIPTNFNIEPNSPFDGDYMKKLFKIGYQLGSDHYPWHKYPPGFEEIK